MKVVLTDEARKDLEPDKLLKGKFYDFVRKFDGNSNLTRLDGVQVAWAAAPYIARLDPNYRVMMVRLEVRVEGEDIYLIAGIKRRDEVYSVSASAELQARWWRDALARQAKLSGKNDGSVRLATILRATGTDRRPIRVSRRLVEQAVRVLPPIHRARYREEWRAELAEIAETAGWRRQLAFALLLVCYSVPRLRRELRGVPLDEPIRDESW